ncbi:uncharacterized protein LOC125799517 isoform X2 [Astyanax mexicanus]|uniref:uncharacterized protein LOC125799517 isoform X2 n=1 Tax=Astyanax mexicanus TaxID=7994 RepID=UPI0020CAD51C|nr:uncharacterized protein LOC125799517 isoform X2 [Astyanax mexicanus]
MCAVRGILGAASIAVLAVAAGGSLYYLYRSRIQKPTTMEETVITQVEGDPETVEERQAEPMVEPVLCETVMELMEEDGGVDCPQEEDQATLIMDEAPEALSLLQVSDLTESEEAEVTINTELCESVVEILVEDGGIDCPQEEDQATHIMNGAASLLLGTDPAETKEAEREAECRPEAESKKKQRKRGRRGRSRKLRRLGRLRRRGRLGKRGRRLYK